MIWTMTPGIRRWEPSAAIVSIIGARPAKPFCFLFFLFYVIYFWDLVLFMLASSGHRHCSLAPQGTT
jgi:hypothetical protein